MRHSKAIQITSGRTSGHFGIFYRYVGLYESEWCLLCKPSRYCLCDQNRDGGKIIKWCDKMYLIVCRRHPSHPPKFWARGTAMPGFSCQERGGPQHYECRLVSGRSAGKGKWRDNLDFNPTSDLCIPRFHDTVQYCWSDTTTTKRRILARSL